jgi:hypothetical protein
VERAGAASAGSGSGGGQGGGGRVAWCRATRGAAGALRMAGRSGAAPRAEKQRKPEEEDKD